uniref:Uncharacterized protein n=1 Tax=Arundo donax TaxID=35708 RepID=A0A0A8ZTQ3_ARUDO
MISPLSSPPGFPFSPSLLCCGYHFSGLEAEQFVAALGFMVSSTAVGQ